MGVKAKDILNSKAGMAVAAIAALSVVGYLAAKKTANVAKEAAEDVGDAINPTNPGNIFNSGVNAVGESISGQKDWTLGGWIYDITHPDEAKATNAVTKYSPAWNNYDREQLRQQGTSGGFVGPL